MKVVDVFGFEGLYTINDIGLVYSCRKGKYMKNQLDKDGYCVINLRGKDGSVKGVKIHRLVASHFIPNPENKETVNHKNGIKTDNSIDNLEWCSIAENIRHAKITGLINLKGENNPMSKLKDSQREEILKLRIAGSTLHDLAEMFGISFSQVSIITRKCGYRIINHVKYRRTDPILEAKKIFKQLEA